MKLSDLFKKNEPQPVAPTPKMMQIMMPDGTPKDFPEHYLISDKENCVACPDYPFEQYKLYHIYLNCEGLKYESSKTGKIPQACKIKDMKSQGFTLCSTCSRAEYNQRHGRPLES